MILQVAKLGPVSRAAGMDCEYPLDWLLFGASFLCKHVTHAFFTFASYKL